MHLLVLSAFRLAGEQRRRPRIPGLNAPFGAQCFPTQTTLGVAGKDFDVSMHLLVLSAFRRPVKSLSMSLPLGLNAPFGAQCFPTSFLGVHGARPSASQCTFWCSVLSDASAELGAFLRDRVSMHLLVLSAFRPDFSSDERSCDEVSMHLLVLSAFRRAGRLPFGLSYEEGLNAPFGAQCFPTHEV